VSVLKKIETLEENRIDLKKRIHESRPWFLLWPVLIFLFGLFKSPIFSLAALIFFSVISYWVYHLIFSAKKHNLQTDLKMSLLAEYMETHYPEIQYQYSSHPKHVDSIIDNTDLIDPKVYNEEDVIMGTFKGLEFYISEVELNLEPGKDNYKDFKGMLFKLKIPGKKYPRTKLKSQPGFFENFFGPFIDHTKYDFSYNTESEDAFHKELGPILPFINHLIKNQGDIRLQTQGDELVLLMGSEAKFLDPPEPNINQSFMHNRYFEGIGKQINSFLFIVESLANNLTENVIEEKLELKAIELVKSKLGKKR